MNIFLAFFFEILSKITEKVKHFPCIYQLNILSHFQSNKLMKIICEKLFSKTPYQSIHKLLDPLFRFLTSQLQFTKSNNQSLILGNKLLRNISNYHKHYTEL